MPHTLLPCGELDVSPEPDERDLFRVGLRGRVWFVGTVPPFPALLLTQPFGPLRAPRTLRFAGGAAGQVDHFGLAGARSVPALMLTDGVADGVADGVDHYGTPADWPTAFTIASRDIRDLVDLVHHAEEGDPDGVRWLRSKRHDDKAAALLRFPHPQPPVSVGR